MQKISNFFLHPFVKNNLFFTMGSYLFRIFQNIVLFSVLARIFPLEEFGIISLILMMSRIIFTVVDFGHRLQIVKEISIDKNILTPRYIEDKMTVKFMLFLGCFIPFIMYALYNDLWNYSLLILPFIGLIGYYAGIASLQFAIFQGREWFKYETYSLFVLTIFSGIALLFTYWTKSVTVFFGLYSFAHFMHVLYGSVMINRKEKLPISSSLSLLRFDPKVFYKEISTSWVFGLIVIAEIVLTSLDSFFVESYFSKVDLSYFEAIKKIVIGLTILCIILNVAFMPPLTKLANNITSESVKKLLVSHLAVLIIGILGSGVYVYFNSTVIRLLFGNLYSEIATWDTLVILFTLSIYLRLVPSIYFLGTHREKVRLWITTSFIILGLIIYPFFLANNNIRNTIIFTSIYNFLFSICLNVFFLYFLWKDYKANA